MQCKKCLYAQTRVIESRHDSPDHIRRRRECPRCAARFTTHERLKETKRQIDDRYPTAKPGRES